MVDSPSGRQEFLAKLDNHSISISALNCSGNPLYPGVIGEALPGHSYAGGARPPNLD